MISIILFLGLLISLGLFVSVIIDKRIEECIPITMFLSVEIVFLFGLCNHLLEGVIVLFGCDFILFIWILTLRKKGLVNSMIKIKSLFSPAIIVLIIMSMLYVYCNYGRVARGIDEFSFWATSVKQMFVNNSFYCMPNINCAFPEYPPGMQTFEFILQAINGRFSEWRLYFSYQIYIAVLFLPFIQHIKHKNVLNNILICGIIFSVGSVFFYEDAYELMVDYALGLTFAFALSQIWLMKDNRDWIKVVNIVLSTNMIILIKSAGILFAVIVLVTFIIRLTINYRQSSKTQWNKMAIMGVGFLLPCSSYFLWKMKYQALSNNIAFDSSKYNIKEFISIIIGNAEGDKADILQNYIEYLTEEKINFGFFHITNIQLLLLLMILLLVLAIYCRKTINGCTYTIPVVFVGSIIYWMGLLASYLYTFRLEEGLALAGIQRYLSIYYIAMAGVIVFITLFILSILEWESLQTTVVLLVISSFFSFHPVINIMDRMVVKESKNHRVSYDNLADKIREDNVDEKEEKDTVLIINQNAKPYECTHTFSFILYPEYEVPYQCAYGSKLMGEGDTDTRVFTQEEFLDNLEELSVDYVAIYELNEDFIQCYHSIFDAKLVNGQVYKYQNGQLILVR